MTYNSTGATATQRPHLAKLLWRCDHRVEGGDVPVMIDRHSTHRAAQRPIGFADGVGLPSLVGVDTATGRNRVIVNFGRETEGMMQHLLWGIITSVNFTITFYFFHLLPCLCQPTVVTFGTYFGR